MCEQTEINYLDGDVVWVKLGTCWWPGQVIGLHNLPDDIRDEFKKKPIIAAVKFFQEDTYEFVKNYQQIYKYNCTLKDEFIKKGLDKYRSKSKDGASYMKKFPGDVEMAEKLTNGDPDILNRKEFCPEEKPDISALFGEKKIPKRKRDRDDMQRRSDGSDGIRKITHPRFLGGESDHEVRIRQQPSSSLPGTPTSTGSPQYLCHICNFSSSRINVIICHQKIHRSDGDSPKIKSYSQSHSTMSDTSTPKRKYIRKDKSQSSKKKKDNEAESRKRKQIKQSEKISKKKKSDPELREKLLADWDDESDEETSINLNSTLNNSFNGSPTKNQSSDNSELNENNGENDNNEIIEESEKLLKETEELSSIQIHDSLDNLHTSKNIRLSSFDRKCESEKDIKASGTSLEKSPKKNTSNSDSDNKNISNTDDKKSRLSCFDFDEDDLSEPSIPPVRKIPRVFGEKSLSLKKEIIKEFEMSQALKNEIKKESSKTIELEKSMELKADEIMEIIQGSDYLQEKKEAKASEKSDERIRDKIEVKQPESKAEIETAEQKNKHKSKSSTCEADMEIVEASEAEKDRSNDHATDAKKSIDKNLKTTISEISVKGDEASEKKDEMPASTTKANDGSFQPEKADSGNATAKSSENVFTKETDDTLSERFTTETEDETVSESADTIPEQSENSDIDLDRERNVDDSFSGNRVAQMIIKRGRGRPRKNAKSINRGGSVDKSPKAKVNKNKKFHASETIEIEPKASDSDTDRSYSGRRRKPNKKYLGSDIYVQNPDYKAFKTDESQSESDDKASEKIRNRSRRGRRSKGANSKSSELVTQIDKQEIEIADQTVAVDNESVSSIDTKHETSISNVSKEMFVEKPEKKLEETKRDVLKEAPKLPDKTATAIADADVPMVDVDVLTPEVTSKTDSVKLDLDKTVAKTPSKTLEKEDSVKQDKDIKEDAKDGEKSVVAQRAESESETYRDISKTNVLDMLPPKKSQIKKFELSQIDILDTDMQTNKTIQIETEPECKIESESGHQPEPERQLESQHKPELKHQAELKNDGEKKKNKESETKVKASMSGISDEIAKFLNTESEEDKKQVSLEITQVESQEKLEEPSEKKTETQSVDKILEKSEEISQPELKSPEKFSSANKSDSVGDTSKSIAKINTEQPITPKKSTMETRYKGKFTPETGAKGKKDKDFSLEEQPINTFQEAFLKTLQMDKKKIMADDIETSPIKGKKGKKVTKKKVEEDTNIVTALSVNPEELNKDIRVLENIPTEGSSALDISVMSNLENVNVVVENKPGANSKIGDIVFEAGQLGSLSGEFVIVPKLSLQSTISETNAKSISDLKKEETPKTIPAATSSLSSTDISVPVKKREMPRIIENVTLTEPVQILKTKLLDKIPQKGVKHKLEDVTKKGDSKSSPKAKIMKIEALPSNTKVKTNVKLSPTGSSHMSLNKKLQILKTDEKDAILEAQKEKQNVPSTQTLVTTEKYIQQSSQSLADMELDINSMPFVLSEDVLTPESIEQMPVVISSIIPASSSISTATISFTPTTQIGQSVQTTQFKLTNDTSAETTPSKKKSGVPAILKNKKARPTVTSVKTLVPPLTGGVKGLKFQGAQSVSNAPSLLAQKGTVPGKYVVVQTTGGQQLRYSVQGKAGTQQKIAIPTGKTTAGNAQVVHQGGKVVILTSAQSCQPKMVPLNISKSLSGKMQRIMTSKGQVLCPINPQGSIITSKKIIAPKTDTSGSPTTSKLVTSSHKIINTQSIITSKGVLTPITGKTTLLGTLSQGIITKGGIYTPISASALGGKTIIGSKTLVTKGTTLLSPQSLSGGKAILTPVSQTIAGKTILGTQTIVGSKGTVLTPITGQQVKAIAAKSPTKVNKVQYHQPVQQKMQLQPILHKSPKVPLSSPSQARTSGTLKSAGNTLVLQNTVAATQKSTPHGKKTKQTAAAVQGIASPSGAQQTVTMMQSQIQPKGGKAASSMQKVIIPRTTGRQIKTQQKIVVQKLQEPAVTAVQTIHTKQTGTANAPIVTKITQAKQTTPTKSLVKSQATKAQNQAQKNLLNVGMNSIATATTNVANIVTTLALPPLESIDAEKKVKMDMQLIDAGQKEQGKCDKIQTEKSSGATTERVEEAKPVAAQPQIMALPTESSDGTQTYVLVTIDEQGQIQPLDNNTLMSLEGTTQNPDGTRTLYIDPSSLGETGTLDNIVLQFDNGILPNIQTNVTTEPSQTIISESYSTPEVIQTSNQDILAAALANTDFQQEMNLSESQTGNVMTTGLTQTSLINQTILQSTIIPPTEPISSPSVLETSLTLNQPIMTPLEVPSNLPIQSDTTSTSSSVVSTIPASLELPITITNPNISYISTGEAQIQIPGNSMPDIGEIMENPVGGSAEMERTEEISASTQYLVIPNLEDSIATVTETQSVESTKIAIPSASYSVTMSNSIVLESSQVQTTPSMPIIDDTFADNASFANKSIVDVSVSDLISKAPVTVENIQSQDITVTSDMLVSSHQSPASSQKSIISTDKAKSLDEEQATTIQEDYSSREIPITSEKLILQQSLKNTSASVSGAMDVTQEVEADDKEMINKTISVTSESDSRVKSLERMDFEVTDTNELKDTSDSHKANTEVELKQLSFPEKSDDKVNLMIDRQVMATSNQVEATSQVLSTESLNPSNDAAMEVDDETVETGELYAGSSTTTKRSADCPRDEPSSQEKSKSRFEEDASTEAAAASAASQETPSQSYEQFGSMPVTSDSADLPSQSATKSSESSAEATQSIVYEPMETDEVETVVTEPPTQSFEHAKINEASQSYETSAEANVNAPTQSFNEIMQSKEEQPSADQTVDDQSYPTQSYEIDKAESAPENLETDAEISQEGNVPSQSNDIGADGIGTSSVSTNNSGLNEDETASSSYVPETPENQERDQEDQESAISTSSYEIPPCEELNIASSSVIPDTSVSAEHSNIHDNGVPEIPTSSYNLNPDITSTHVDSGPTSSYEDRVIVEQNVSTSYEVPISMPGLDETCSQNFVTESTDHRNEPSSYYAHHQEVTASYYESMDQDASSRLESGDSHEEVTPGYYEGNPQEVSQSYFAPAEETPSYTSHSISPSYYDPRPESEASQSYYSTDDLDKTEQSSSPNIEASQSFYQERSGELRLRQQGEATPTYPEGYPVDYTLENSPIERHDLVESSVPATRPMER